MGKVSLLKLLLRSSLENGKCFDIVNGFKVTLIAHHFLFLESFVCSLSRYQWYLNGGFRDCNSTKSHVRQTFR